MFHGLSTPDDLITMWKELKHDEDDKDMNVIFEYVKPEQLKDGFNIINVKYKPGSNETGHYALITNYDNYKEFFDPIADNIINDIDIIKDIDEYLNGVLVSFEGKQKYGNSDCGYHCLTHALNLYNSDKLGGKLPANPTKQDILLDILKLNRAIYYQLKTLSDNKIISNKLKQVGKGLSDDIDKDVLKDIEYKKLKNLIEKN